MSGSTALNQDFKEFIKSLNDNAVRYLVVGDYAVALHGYPRYTKDIDIWVEMTNENVSKVIEALGIKKLLAATRTWPIWKPKNNQIFVELIADSNAS